MMTGSFVIDPAAGTIKGFNPNGPRPLHAIARDVRKHWPKVNYAAVPYLDAMGSLEKITDAYYADSAADIVRYFLANATTWRGDDAKRIKAELKAMVGMK